MRHLYLPNIYIYRYTDIYIPIIPPFMPTGDTNLLQKNYTQIYCIWVWNDYFLTAHSPLIYYRCTFYWLSWCTGFTVAGFRASGTNHFTTGQSFSRFVGVTDHAIWSKSKRYHVSSRKQIQCSRNHHDCFNSPRLAAIQQSPICQVTQVRAVKQFICLGNSVRRSIYDLIKHPAN